VVISVNIPDGTERILAEQAALGGQSVESYAAELIRKGVIGGRTFAEILAPFRKQVANSDMSDAKLDELFEAARNEVHDAKQGAK
jgi:plasmid stability protein